MVYIYLGILPFQHKKMYYVVAESAQTWGIDYKVFFLMDAALVALFAILSGIFFTTRKAKKKGREFRPFRDGAKRWASVIHDG